MNAVKNRARSARAPPSARPPQEDPRFVAVDAAAPLEQHFPADAKLLYLEAPYCGAPVTVMDWQPPLTHARSAPAYAMP